jgi:hypothetical protein
LRRILAHVGCQAGSVHGKRGKGYIHRNIHRFISAARHAKWLVVVDLDHDYLCAPELVVEWLPNGLGQLGLRVAVKAIESWLLADRERIARFLGVRVGAVPDSPDDLDDPKTTMINLARGSSRREIREGIVPSLNGGRSIGPDYNRLFAEFIAGHRESWRPRVAIQNSDSLRRCVGNVHRIQQQ